MVALDKDVNLFSTGFVNPVGLSAIRPDIPQSLPATTPAGPSAQAKAAQAAFFRAALNEVQATPPRPQAAQTTPTAQASEPESPRLPRLGQLLDIRVCLPSVPDPSSGDPGGLWC